MSIKGKRKTAVAEEYMDDEESAEEELDKTNDDNAGDIFEGEEIIE